MRDGKGEITKSDPFKKENRICAYDRVGVKRGKKIEQSAGSLNPRRTNVKGMRKTSNEKKDCAHIFCFEIQFISM